MRFFIARIFHNFYTIKFLWGGVGVGGDFLRELFLVWAKNKFFVELLRPFVGVNNDLLNCCCFKVPKREIFDRSDFPDFYTINSIREGDFGVKI